MVEPDNTNLRGSLFCVDSVALLMLNDQQFFLFGQIQTGQTIGQPYSYTYPYGECSLVEPWSTR